MSDWMTGQEAAELTGKSIAEIDAAAASGALDAQYQGWQLMVGYRVEGVTTETPDDHTVSELKQLLDQRGVEYPSKALKAELIELVRQTE